MKQNNYEKLVSYIIENQNSFYRLAYSYTHNQENALDIVQNAICKALSHYESLRNEHAVKTWFYRILVNESLLFLRNQKDTLLSGDGEIPDIPYYEKGYEHHDDLYGQINQLDEEVQSIIKLRFFEELSLKEIADITGTNLNTVKARLYRGLKLLKQNLGGTDMNEVHS